MAEYHKCTRCGNVYQAWPHVEDGPPYWDSSNTVSAYCQRCHQEVRYNFDSDTPVYCRHCDRFVMTYKGCPNCGCEDYENYYGSSCFIATACVISKGLPDNCEELMLLRHWRDRLIHERSGFKELVEDYYEHAPKIVTMINSLENSQDIYDELYQKLVIESIEHANKNQIDVAINNYLDIYYSLKERLSDYNQRNSKS